MDAEPEPIPITADDAMSMIGGGDNSFQDMDDVEGTDKHTRDIAVQVFNREGFV